jgi:membrane fusion protein (multidrug efflux system)
LMRDKISRSLIGALSAIFILTSACSGSDEKSRPERGAPEVGFVTVTPQSVPLTAELSGRTTAFETSEVRPQVTGLIRKRLFTEGAYVRAGQPLYQIDPSLYQANVQQAQANLASARARASAAEEKMRRLKPLAEMQAVAEQDYTDAAADAGIARAAVAQSQAALETARINLRFASITAPISGRIGRSIATPGALVSASQADPLAVIQQLDPIYVDIQQSSAELTRLRQSLAKGGLQAGDTAVRLKLEDGSLYGPVGKIEFSDVTVNENTGTVVLRARFPNPNSLLLPGMFVTAIMEQAVTPNAILVPQPAVLRDFDGSAFVMLVGKDNKTERRKVTTDRTVTGQWVISEGLKAGDKVITQGLNNLKHDMPIRPVPAETVPHIGPREKGQASAKASTPAKGG